MLINKVRGVEAEKLKEAEKLRNMSAEWMGICSKRKKLCCDGECTVMTV